MPPEFRNQDTERFANGEHVRKLQGVPRKRAFIALDRLDAAVQLFDLTKPPGNRFEALRGNREGQFSIRINDQWRVCFGWDDQQCQPFNIEIVDVWHRRKCMVREAIHPGEHIAGELDELGMSASELARTLNIPRNRLTELIRGRRGISADTALRLSRWLGTTPEFWMNLQRNYELRIAEEKTGEEIRQTIKPLKPAA